MERKKRSKGRGWESCYVKKIYGTFGVEMRAYGQKLVKFCTHTHAAKLVVEIPCACGHKVFLFPFAHIIFICLPTCESLETIKLIYA